MKMESNIRKMARTALIIHLLLACALFSLYQLGRPAAAEYAPLGITPTATDIPPDPPTPVDTPTPVFTPITPAPAPTATPTSEPPPMLPSVPPPDEPPPSGQARIRSSKSADVTSVSPDEQVDFTIHVCNEGDQAAENVVVSDGLPPELALVSASASQGSVVIEGNGMRAELGSLGAGACAEITIVARVRADVAPGVRIRNVASTGALYDDVEIKTVGLLLPESGTPDARRALAGLLLTVVSGVFVALALRKRSTG